MANDGSDFAVGYEMQVLVIYEYQLGSAVLENVSDFLRSKTRVNRGKDGAGSKNGKVGICKRV